MKRDEVETMLRHATAAEQQGYLLCNVAPHRLAELCRTVLDAPVADYRGSTHSMKAGGQTEVVYRVLDQDYIGPKRVRLVPEGSE